MTYSFSDWFRTELTYMDANDKELARDNEWIIREAFEFDQNDISFDTWLERETQSFRRDQLHAIRRIEWVIEEAWEAGYNK